LYRLPSLGHFRDAGQVEIQVTRPGEQPVQFDQGGRRNAILCVEVAAIAQLGEPNCAMLASIAGHNLKVPMADRRLQSFLNNHQVIGRHAHATDPQ
jgi:hypothetical protein